MAPATDYANRFFEASEAPFSIMIYKVTKAAGLGAAGVEGGAFKVHVALVMPADRAADFEEIIADINHARKFGGILIADKVEVRPSKVGLYADVPCIVRKGNEDHGIALGKLARGSAKMRGHKATADRFVDGFLQSLAAGAEVDQAFNDAGRDGGGEKAVAKGQAKGPDGSKPKSKEQSLSDDEQAKLGSVLKDLRTKIDQAPAAPPPPPDAPAAPEGPICPSCQEPVEASWVRCPSCGNALGAPAAAAPEPEPSPMPSVVTQIADAKPPKAKKGAEILKAIKSIYEQLLAYEGKGEGFKETLKESRDLLEQAVKAYQEKDYEMAQALTKEASESIAAITAATAIASFSRGPPARPAPPAPSEPPAPTVARVEREHEVIPEGPAVPPRFVEAAKPPAPEPVAAADEIHRPALVASPSDKAIPADSPYLNRDGNVHLEKVLGRLRELAL